MSYGLMPTAFNMTVLNHADLERMGIYEIEERAKAMPLILSASHMPQEEICQKLQDSLRIHYDRWVTGEYFDTKLHECVNERVDPEALGMTSTQIPDKGLATEPYFVRTPVPQGPNRAQRRAAARAQRRKKK